MENAKASFDALDRKILELLQADVTLSLAAVAARVGSSKSVCWRRIQRFLDEGVICGRVALLDPKKLGLGVMVFIFVKIDGRGQATLTEFVKALEKLPEVMECHALMGEVDLMLKVIVPSIEYYDEFLWRKLSNLPAVVDVRSTISLTRFISTTRLPLTIFDEPRTPSSAARRPVLGKQSAGASPSAG